MVSGLGLLASPRPSDAGCVIKMKVRLFHWQKMAWQYAWLKFSGSELRDGDLRTVPLHKWVMMGGTGWLMCVAACYMIFVYMCHERYRMVAAVVGSVSGIVPHTYSVRA